MKKEQKANCVYYNPTTVLNYPITIRDYIETVIDTCPEIVNLIGSEQKEVRKFYHNFQTKDRDITLCILTLDNGKVCIGYSVRVFSDEVVNGLSKKISLGRARKNPIDGGFISKKYVKHNGVLKGIAFFWETEFKKDLGKFVKGYKKQ